MKKTIIFIVIILILLSFGITFYITNKKLSKDEFISLMNSFENVSNVKLEGDLVTRYIKDDCGLSITKSSFTPVTDEGMLLFDNSTSIDRYSYVWFNSKTKECIGYIPSDKQYMIMNYAESDSVELEEAEYTFIRI